MTAPVSIQDGVRFTPSRVEGAAGSVVEVAVLPDRIELLSADGGLTKLPLSTIAPPPEPPTVFGRFLPGKVRRPPVAALSFSPARYEDSYIRFMSTPPLTVYMPAEGPARFPDSVFSRILRVLSAGGHRFYDVTNPPPPPDSYERLPRGPRTVVDGVMLLCVVNFIVFLLASLALHGNGLMEGRMRDGHYYLGKPYREREVSRAVWTFTWWHGVITLASLPALALTGFATEAYAKRVERPKRTTP